MTWRGKRSLSGNNGWPRRGTVKEPHKHKQTPEKEEMLKSSAQTAVEPISPLNTPYGSQSVWTRVPGHSWRNAASTPQNEALGAKSTPTYASVLANTNKLALPGIEVLLKNKK